MPWPSSCSKPLDIEKRVPRYLDPCLKSIRSSDVKIQLPSFPFGCYTNPGRPLNALPFYAVASPYTEVMKLQMLTADRCFLLQSCGNPYAGYPDNDVLSRQHARARDRPTRAALLHRIQQLTVVYLEPAENSNGEQSRVVSLKSVDDGTRSSLN